MPILPSGDTDEVGNALQFLLGSIPQEHRAEVARRLLAELEWLHTAVAGVHPPTWMASLHARQVIGLGESPVDTLAPPESVNLGRGWVGLRLLGLYLIGVATGIAFATKGAGLLAWLLGLDFGIGTGPAPKE